MASLQQIEKMIDIWERAELSFSKESPSIRSKFERELDIAKTVRDGMVRDGLNDTPSTETPLIIGYARVFNGGCEYCKVAAERLYYKSVLLPIHIRCNCGIRAVFKGEDHGLFHPPSKAHPSGEIPNRLAQVLPYPVDLDAEYYDWFQDLDDDELGALSQYIGTDAFRVNEFLRHGHKDDWQWFVDILDSVMKPLSHDTLVYRGIGRGAIKELFGNGSPQVGGILEDKGFMSTTVIETLSEAFADPGIRVEILAPKGTPAAWLGDIGNEGELLLSRGLKIQITEVVSPWHIKARVL